MLYSTYIKKRANVFDKHKKFLEDKINSKEAVKKLGVQVPELYHVMDKVDEIKNIKLPENCVIKFNNLSCSKGVVIRKNNTFLKYKNLNEVIDYLKKYENIKSTTQKLMVEELLKPSENVLYDVKCFCFYGEVKFIHVINPDQRNQCFMFDTKGNIKYIYKGDEYAKKNKIIKPKFFDRIIKRATTVAENLVKDYALRIDFYSTTKGVMFGEFTFNPRAGNGLTEEGDKLMGSFLKNGSK